ncbi:hypothetical protein B0T26DRAFT_682182 [Lasiosphaeria miniovina]|uniref:MULE transposase domain-containing protein n=1 Tax=Lasiosphaeria miniovina TaxID=1954250 RepID=A0AA39ZRC9_9PEZI|nr:uncharacterized protein B0T26DRAFT_682182 [Lasiosphaeria miniovina]KAK0702114.1 hypothetical protein B0T26DRAFT_682182 [Lasiosphaeria miniovina]
MPLFTPSHARLFARTWCFKVCSGQVAFAGFSPSPSPSPAPSPSLLPSPAPTPSPSPPPSPGNSCRDDFSPAPSAGSDSEEAEAYGPEDTWTVDAAGEPLFCGDPADEVTIIDRMITYQHKKTGETNKFFFQCDQADYDRHPVKTLEAQETSSRKKAKDCPFRICLQRKDRDDGWTARPLNLTHKGHGPSGSPSQHEMFRRKATYQEEEDYIIDLTHQSIPAKAALRLFKTKFPYSNIITADVYNIMRDYRQSQRDGYADAQAFVKKLESGDYYCNIIYKDNTKTKMLHAFWVTRRQLKMWAKFGACIGIDATYRANNLRMPLLVGALIMFFPDLQRQRCVWHMNCNMVLYIKKYWIKPPTDRPTRNATAAERAGDSGDSGDSEDDDDDDDDAEDIATMNALNSKTQSTKKGPVVLGAVPTKVANTRAGLFELWKHMVFSRSVRDFNKAKTILNLGGLLYEDVQECGRANHIAK